MLVASALGYEERTAGVFDLGLGGEIVVEVGLIPRPLPLDGILVDLDRPVFEHVLLRNGFLRRYQRNAGGLYLTPHDISRAAARSTEDRFIGRPGLRVGPIRHQRGGESLFAGEEVLMESSGTLCAPTVYIDGVRLGHPADVPTVLSSIVPLPTVQAVEVYRSPAEVPVEYNATRTAEGALCGVLVVWTGG